jgi:hypothetical protein
MKLEFSRQVSKKSQISSFIKIRLVEAEFFPCEQTDGQMDMTKLIAAFLNFLRKRLKMEKFVWNT